MTDSMAIINTLYDKLRFVFDLTPDSVVSRIQSNALDEESSSILLTHVDFYRSLSESDRLSFNRRVKLFLDTTDVVGNGVEVLNVDRLLVAAGAIIPVWGFPEWHYFNLQEVILVPGAFNESSEFGEDDSTIQGMVGSGAMSGKMILSQQALHYGFSNSQDKRNVAIHEFVHLIDMADGECDGFPERLTKYAYSIPWFDLVGRKMQETDETKTNINHYGGTNSVEFLAVVTEYFFERPTMFQRKHAELYKMLSHFYQQDVASIKRETKIRKKAPCPCQSGKRYKHCCYPGAL
ncbi:zinc-dependent peptidase [Pseudomonadota bacterium]